MSDYTKAAAAAKAWRAAYAAGWNAYQGYVGGEQSKVDAAVAAAVLTYLNKCPDLESAARTLAGRAVAPRRVLEAEDRRDFREQMAKGSLGCRCGHLLSDHDATGWDRNGDPVGRDCRMTGCGCGRVS